MVQCLPHFQIYYRDIEAYMGVEVEDSKRYCDCVLLSITKNRGKENEYETKPMVRARTNGEGEYELRHRTISERTVKRELRNESGRICPLVPAFRTDRLLIACLQIFQLNSLCCP